MDEMGPPIKATFKKTELKAKLRDKTEHFKLYGIV